jgi:hypothetical protein
VHAACCPTNWRSGGRVFIKARTAPIQNRRISGGAPKETFFMSRLLFTAAIVALLSACSSMSGGTTTGSSGMSRTNEMGAAGYIGSGNHNGASGGGPN